MATLSRSLILISLFSSFTSMALAQSTDHSETTSQAMAPPACADACVKTATSIQSCAPGDQACLCLASSQIQQSVVKCLDTTTTCSAANKDAAYEYYPALCRSLNLEVGSSTSTRVATADAAVATTTPGGGSHSSSEATQSTSNAGSDKNIHAGLQLPAILGITLAVIIMVVGVIALVAWSCLRRRRMARKPRMDLGGELFDPLPRPPRSRSINSDFIVQPSTTEKEAFGSNLSRTSTLVPPPPIAKDEKRSSEDKRNSARGRALKTLLSGDGLRSSFRSSRSESKQSSLMVPPLDITKTQESNLRISKI